jgi:hypothetical protein
VSTYVLPETNITVDNLGAWRRIEPLAMRIGVRAAAVSHSFAAIRAEW